MDFQTAYWTPSSGFPFDSHEFFRFIIIHVMIPIYPCILNLLVSMLRFHSLQIVKLHFLFSPATLLKSSFSSLYSFLSPTQSSCPNLAATILTPPKCFLLWSLWFHISKYNCHFNRPSRGTAPSHGFWWPCPRALTFPWHPSPCSLSPASLLLFLNPWFPHLCNLLLRILIAQH